MVNLLQLIEIVEEGEVKLARPKTWRFGNMESDGILRWYKTLDGGRTISEFNLKDKI
jgi:hypothetical protein